MFADARERAANALWTALDVAVVALFVACIVVLGVAATDAPLVSTLVLVGAFGIPTLVDAWRGVPAAQTRRAVAWFVAACPIYVTAAAQKIAPAGVLEGATLLVFGVTVAVAGTSLYVLAAEDETRVPYLSHYVETGEWSA